MTANDNSNEQKRQSAEAVARSQNVNGRILARAYKSIADRSRLLEGLTHVREELAATIQAIDRLRESVEEQD